MARALCAGKGYPGVGKSCALARGTLVWERAVRWQGVPWCGKELSPPPLSESGREAALRWQWFY